MLRKTLLMSLVFFMLFILSRTAFSGEKITIGYCDNNFNDTFHSFMLDAATSYAREHGIELMIMDAMLDSVRQQDHVHTVINSGVKAVIVIPNDTSAVSPMTEAAREAGIPVIYLNQDPFNGVDVPDGAYYVGSPTKEGGIMQMEYIGEKMDGKGNVCILMGMLTTEAAYSRTDGVEETAGEKFPGIRILSKETALWQRDQAVTVTENWLTAFGDQIDAIIANNDEMAIGAANALAVANKPNILTAGIDGTPDALGAIQSGRLTVSVLQDAVGQGRGAVELAHKLINGGESERVIWIPLELITRDNVEKFMQK